MGSKRIWIAFDQHDPGGYVWAIREGFRWHRAREVHVAIPLETVYKGRGAKQPRAYLRGWGQVYRWPDGTLEVR